MGSCPCLQFRLLARAPIDERAKRPAYHDLEPTTSLKVTLPWVTQEFEDTRALMGDNFWPYDVKANLKELSMRYAFEHGLAKRRLAWRRYSILRPWNSPRGDALDMEPFCAGFER